MKNNLGSLSFIKMGIFTPYSVLEKREYYSQETDISILVLILDLSTVLFTCWIPKFPFYSFLTIFL